MPAFLTGGTIVGILSFLGAISVAFKMPALGAFLSDPTTATTLTTVISGGLAIVAGVMKGVKGTTPPTPTP